MLNLAIVVPLYNPHNDWFDAMCNSIAGLDVMLKDVDYSIVLVNDGSTCFDESDIDKLKAKTSKISYLSYPKNQGKGYCIRHGLRNIEADFYVYTDIDFPFGYEIIYQMYDRFVESKTCLMIGIRNKEYFRLLPTKRKIISKLLHLINYVLTGFKVHDTQAGIKGFDNKAKQVFLATKTDGFLFDLEFIRGCLHQNLSYAELNVHPRHNIHFSDFRTPVIAREFKNLIRIIFRF